MTNSGAGGADPYESEQKKVNLIYGRFDRLKDLVKGRLSSTRAQKDLNLTSMTERDSFATMYEDRLSFLRTGEYRLVFGKLRMKDGSDRYIGRMGLLEGQKPVLLDWRAPASSPFYEATYFDDMGARLRRHITTDGRKVVKLEDELLDLTPEQSKKALEEGLLNGEGALMAALEEGRTGKMGDIVSTIQREQNRIIRMPLDSAVVVQGGPGSGKSAVALHRAAYLLYTYRKELEGRGVLIVGPSRAFVHYIDDVLPCLGESGILTLTMAEMIPGVETNCEDSPLAARVKGDLRMVRLLKSAVGRRIRIPKKLPEISLNGVKLNLKPEDIALGQLYAKGSGPYEVARRAFVDRMCQILFEKYANAAGGLISDEDEDFIKGQIRENAQVRLALNLSWLPLSARWVLDDLFSKPDKLKALAPWMSDEEAGSLIREKGKTSEGDIPLLDALMDILGEDQVKKKAPSAGAEEEFAKSTMAMFGVSPSMVSASDLLSSLAPLEQKPVAERAAEDRNWKFGHVIVDEAQELTPMQWRMLRKRAASKSFTIVGDVAQASSPGGTRSWKNRLSAIFDKDWTLCPLEIDYRNPRQVVEEAARLAEREGLSPGVLKAVRSVEGSLEKVESEDPEEEAVKKLVECAKRFVRSTRGTAALVAQTAADAERLSDKALRALEKEFGKEEAARLFQNGWKSQVQVRGMDEVKGIEYDAVVLADPKEPEGEGEERKIAASRLYIAMTRPTQKLVIVKKKGEAFI